MHACMHAWHVCLRKLFHQAVPLPALFAAVCACRCPHPAVSGQQFTSIMKTWETALAVIGGAAGGVAILWPIGIW